MNVVLGAARNFGVDPFAKMEMPRVEEVGEKEYKQFKADLDHYMTQIVLETTFQARRDSVEIGADAKSKIRSYLHAIKESVDRADLSDSQKRTLLQKLAEFEKALDGRRLSLAAVALFVLSITTIPGGWLKLSIWSPPLRTKSYGWLERKRWRKTARSNCRSTSSLSLCCHRVPQLSCSLPRIPTSGQGMTSMTTSPSSPPPRA